MVVIMPRSSKCYSQIWSTKKCGTATTTHPAQRGFSQSKIQGKWSSGRDESDISSQSYCSQGISLHDDWLVRKTVPEQNEGNKPTKQCLEVDNLPTGRSLLSLSALLESRALSTVDTSSIDEPHDMTKKEHSVLRL